MSEKHITDMTLLELLELYQEKKKIFYDFRDNEFMKNVSEKDEVTRKRHFKEYDEFKEDVMNVACFIAEKLLK